jgi:hypothetical protein
MKAGREMDALVATEVMKQAVVQGANCMWECGSETGPGLTHTYRATTGFYDPVPLYSTSISAAWEVVEKMRHLDPMVSWDDPKWEVSFSDVWAIADTAPHAICLAALKAVGAM